MQGITSTQKDEPWSERDDKRLAKLEQIYRRAIDRRSMDGERPLIVHNIGRGPQIEDALLQFPITGHFRFRPRSA